MSISAAEGRAWKTRELKPRTLKTQPQPRVTFPAFKQEVQTFRRRLRPDTKARTRWMFGFQRLLVRRWEWEMLCPNPGPLPQISQLAATVISCCLFGLGAGCWTQEVQVLVGEGAARVSRVPEATQRSRARAGCDPFPFVSA